jgi:hypothetical protein
MDKNLLENAGSKMVWRGGHSGLKLEVYEGGVLAVGNGEGKLIVAMRITPDSNKYSVSASLEINRGYGLNNSELRMLFDAIDVAMRS